MKIGSPSGGTVGSGRTSKCVIFKLHTFSHLVVSILPFSHYIWLRDHCRCSKCFHVTTKQRLLDTFSVSRTSQVSIESINIVQIPSDIFPSSVIPKLDGLEITCLWPFSSMSRPPITPNPSYQGSYLHRIYHSTLGTGSSGTPTTRQLSNPLPLEREQGTGAYWSHTG